jgi:hypothetical protein
MLHFATSVVAALAVVLPVAAFAQHNDRLAETLRRPRPEKLAGPNCDQPVVN